MYRILVADDDPIGRAIVVKMIQKLFPEQLEVIQAVNGREAVRLYEEKRCNIALLDIALPGMSGLDVAAKLVRKDTCGVIIFLTTYKDFNYAKRAFSLRALDYLVKPATEEEIFAVLEEAMMVVENKRTLMKLNPDVKTDYRAHEDVKLNAVTDTILEYIKMHYQGEISLQDVAGHLNYSDAYFCKLFKQCFGKNFREFLTEYRIMLAKKLLADISINIKDVGAEVGYQDPNYFTRVFKRTEGVTPTEYRMKLLSGVNTVMPEQENE